MALADTFQQVVDSLPGDWTDLELDLRIDDESRYIDAALYLVTCNAQPYSRHDWHWRLLVAHSFGHAAAVPAVHGALKLLDDAGHHRRAGRARGAQRPRRGRADVGAPGVGAPGVPPPALAVMARVAALIPDLLFGSKVQAALEAAGHEVDLITGAVRGLGRGRRDRPARRRSHLARRRRRRAVRDARHRRRATRRAYPRLLRPRRARGARARAGRPGSTSSSRARGWRARARSWSRGCSPTSVVERPRARETYAQRPLSGARSSMSTQRNTINLLDVEPELGDGLNPQERAAAARVLAVPSHVLEPGPWEPARGARRRLPGGRHPARRRHGHPRPALRRAHHHRAAGRRRHPAPVGRRRRLRRRCPSRPAGTCTRRRGWRSSTRASPSPPAAGRRSRRRCTHATCAACAASPSSARSPSCRASTTA